MEWRLENGRYSTLLLADLIIVMREMKQFNFCIQQKEKQNQSDWSILLSECQGATSTVAFHVKDHSSLTSCSAAM